MKNLTVSQVMVVHSLRKLGPSTSREIAADWEGVSSRAVATTLCWMRGAGLVCEKVKYIKPRKPSVWELRGGV